MHRFSNPVVRGNAPDPSVVRVGADYFLATSTMEFLPGVQIRHSTDLVNWTLIGNAVTRPAQYRRDGRPGDVMLYAPTLRHHAGTFFVVCTNIADEQGNFVVSTDDPAGEWSDAVWIDTGAFDPSLLYDDDRWLYTRRTLDPLPDGRLGPVVQAEIDIVTGVLGEFREITADHQGFCSNDIEGPHVYRIGDWYYLFSAEGSTWKGHMQTCGRSRSAWGPFDPAPNNPVLTHRHRVGHPIQTTGHAELIDDIDGNWWAVHLGTRHPSWAYHHNLGRETFLAPVVWHEEWPIIGNAGTTELEWELDRPLPSGSSRVLGVRDTLWTRGWQTIGQPAADIDADAVERIILPFGDVLAGKGSERPVGALLRTQVEDAEVFEVTLEHLDPEGRAGVAVYSDAAHFYRATVSEEGLTFERVVDDLVHRVDLAAPPTPVDFRIEATAARYRFIVNGVEVGAGSARLLSAEAAEGFVGARFALIAEGDGPGSACFSAPVASEKTFHSEVGTWI